MFKSVVAFIMALALAGPGLGRQATPGGNQAGQKSPQAAAPRAPAGGGVQGFIPPGDVNVRIGPDVRTFVVMAAINVAGFDYEPNGLPLSPARAELRKDLSDLDPKLKEQLAAYYKSHRREGVDEAADAARYSALSLLMTAPPAFSIYERGDNVVPQDLRPLMDFVPLVREFYVKSRIKELVPKYMSVGERYASLYRQPIGEEVFSTLDYLHTNPDTVINLKPLVVTGASGKGDNKQVKQQIVARTRTRQVFVVPDPLGALGSSAVRDDLLNQKDELLARRVGDDYIVLIGPSYTPNVEAFRRAMIRFAIDPLIERHLKASLEYKDPLLKLVSGVPTASKQYGSSVYLVLRESLAEAVEARIKRIQPNSAYTEEDAVFDLSQAYLKGAVLAFHFYEMLTGAEKVGISIEDTFDHMLATSKFDREAARPKEFERVVAKVSAARKANSARAVNAPAAGSAGFAERVVLSDDLIREKRYSEAKAVLERVLAEEPNNARAIYGMARIVNQMPSEVEADPKADEDSKIQAQHDRFKEALKLYRKAIDAASKDSELWLIQWSHVLIGRILDFQEFRADAIQEYEKALALGVVPNGAYNEAREGKLKPYGQQ
ncbi:MAG TPA: tetratricopeptide repeat protein [Blastocatellia bacterium]|nr:tetratricopeptide repeat protein [Blastocatellia bacterium]